MTSELQRVGATSARLLLNARDGAIPAATLRASYNRILALKAGL